MARRRAFIRVILGTIAAVALAAGGATTAVADEDTTTISGSVTRESDGTPLAGVSVYATSTDLTRSGHAVTDDVGAYSVVDLPPGEYIVRFVGGPDTGFISEYWDGASSWDAARRITTVGGDAITGIDASLRLGGSVSGRVTRQSDGSPVEGTWVSLSPNSLSIPPATAWTGPDGTYRATGLVPADYTVRFDSPDDSLADMYWDNALSSVSATPVTVSAGVERSAIDATLIGTSSITGSVTKASDGSPVAGSVTASGGGSGFFSAPIADDGSYVLTVPPGTYLVQFVSYDPRALSEYWQDARTEAEATTVTVGTGQPVSLSATLDAATVLSGTVTAGGVPVADAIVEVWQNGLLGPGMAYTDSAGHYEVFVVPGTYTVSAGGPAYDPIYATRFWKEAATPSEASSVTVTSASGRGGVDFDLSLGGDITGKVTVDGAELPAAGAEVVAYIWSTGAWRPVARAGTGGEYSFGSGGFEGASGLRLPAGTYRIGVESPGYCTQFYGGGESVDDGESVVLAPGQVVDGIDVTLSASCVAPEPAPSLTVTASSVHAGGDLSVSGDGFTAGEVVAFELHSDPIALGSLTADQNGRLSGTLRIPASVPAGAHTLVALGRGAAIQASVGIQVTAAAAVGPAETGAVTTPTRLAVTGGDTPGVMVIAGLFFAVVGLALVRRRRVRG